MIEAKKTKYGWEFHRSNGWSIIDENYRAFYEATGRLKRVVWNSGTIDQRDPHNAGRRRLHGFQKVIMSYGTTRLLCINFGQRSGLQYIDLTPEGGDFTNFKRL
jgi:hypothetical protein